VSIAAPRCLYCPTVSNDRRRSHRPRPDEPSCAVLDCWGGQPGEKDGPPHCMQDRLSTSEIVTYGMTERQTDRLTEIVSYAHVLDVCLLCLSVRINVRDRNLSKTPHTVASSTQLQTAFLSTCHFLRKIRANKIYVGYACVCLFVNKFTVFHKKTLFCFFYNSLK